MTPPISRPLDATLSVTRAARLLGVHPNTVRAWSDAGRLRYYRINRRGDRRYRLGDLQRFMAASESAPAEPGEARSQGVERRLRADAGSGPFGASRTSDPNRGSSSPSGASDTSGNGAETRIAPPARPSRAPGPSLLARPWLAFGSAATANRRRSEHAQMATWAAQLESIQHLGTRLNRLSSAEDIGKAIVGELGLLIEYDNVRVYRQQSPKLVPVALEGHVGEYADETSEQVAVAVGQGLTGWVAANKLSQNIPDTARDPRAYTVPGSTADLDESMILAPMVFDDRVLGVLVLSKLGLGQFSDDDLRLLEIYASFAAQAFSNAETTEQLRSKSADLERQLRGQRDLLSITESILTTLDTHRVLEQVADRLGELVGYENLVIEVVDPTSGDLRPLTARGPHAAWLLRPSHGGETGIASWVTEHRQAVLILDVRDDPRLRHLRDRHQEGSLIAVPLRGRSGTSGVLILERLGEGNRYSAGEFDLVQLFAAQVSIALQNAEVYRVVSLRAATDDLTGLLNHGTFHERLAAQVAADKPFSLIMLDLDLFKNVNDGLGHQAGDRLLSEIARAIEAASRDSDGIFRYGGDEFMIILPDADGDSALRIANRVLATICSLGGPGSRWYRRGVSISASLGVAAYPDHGGTAADILLAADRATQVSKRSGRARISTAADGLVLAAEFTLSEPTPVDSPSV